MGALGCFARLQGSSHPSAGCTGSQWPGNTSGFLCPGCTCPENIHWKGLSALLILKGSLSLLQPSALWPSQTSAETGPTLTPSPGSAVSISGFHGNRRMPGTELVHTTASPAFPGSFRKRVARAGAAHRTLGVGHTAGPDPAAGGLFQHHCAGRELFHPPEKHMWIFLAGQEDKRAQLFQPSICFVCSGPHSLSKQIESCARPRLLS